MFNIKCLTIIVCVEIKQTETKYIYEQFFKCFYFLVYFYILNYRIKMKQDLCCGVEIGLKLCHNMIFFIMWA